GWTRFGLGREACMGESRAERLRGLDWAKLMEAGEVVARDMEVFYPQHRYLNFYVVPLSLDPVPAKRSRADGPERWYAVILRDITETRRSTEETIQSEKLTALTLLAAGVAHEIGNPLNSLHIHLQLMERKAQELDHNATAELQQSIDVARSEVRRLDSIVTQFLRAIRPSQPRLHPENVNTIV